MTHLGLNMAAAYSEKNAYILCFDNNQEKLDQIKKGALPFSEPKLNYLLKKNYKKIFFTSNPSDLKKCNIIFIAEDVKTNKQGISDLTQVKKLITLVRKHANSKAISVLLSQIPPKFTRKHFFNKERVFYQVETLIFGRAIYRAMHPERFIIGCAEPLIPMEPRLKTLRRNIVFDIVKTILPNCFCS